MIILWILAGLILMIILAVLFSPLTLVIDSDRSIYRLSMTGVGDATIIPAWETDDFILFRLRFWLWEWEFSANQLLSKKREKKEPGRRRARKKTKKRKMSFSRIRPKLKRILRSFRIHQFELSLDTNDPVWNAWLFPIAFLASRRTRKLSINFVQYNALRLRVSNRLFNLLRAWVF